MNQRNPIYTVTTCFSKMYSGIVLSSTPRSSEWSFPLGFPARNFMHFSSFPCVLHPRPSHTSWFDHPNDIWWSIHVMKLIIISFMQPPATSSLLGPNILLSTLFSNTVSLCCSLSMRDQVSHPYRTTDNAVVLDTLNLSF